jgi:Flp pilus assembly protein TadG
VTGSRHRSAAPKPRDESGQAMVEFALVLIPFLMLVVGVIQFGIGLNFWLDAQRIANQGARWAAVNCGQDATPPTSPNPCDPNLQTTLVNMATSTGLKRSTQVSICFPSGPTVGNPVTVRLTAPFDFVPVIPIGSFTLKAEATMRIERPPRTPAPPNLSPTQVGTCP